MVRLNIEQAVLDKRIDFANHVSNLLMDYSFGGNLRNLQIAYNLIISQLKKEGIEVHTKLSEEWEVK